MTDKELLQQVLDYMESEVPFYECDGNEPPTGLTECIEAIKAKLAQPDCVCGEPDSEGVHRKDKPCYVEPELLSEKSKGALSQEENKRHNKMILEKFYEENADLYKAQPESEPVAWMNEDVLRIDHIIKAPIQVCRRKQDEHYNIPLYTAPPKKEWVGLTDEEIKHAWSQLWYDLNNGKFAASDDPSRHTNVMFARALEVKLKEKNSAT